MDIRDILSPTEKDAPRSVSSTPNTPKQSPLKYVQRTHSGSILTAPPVKHGHGPSHLSQAVLSQIPAHIMSSANQVVSSPLISPVPTSSSNHPQFTRASSTQSIDTLADVASLQNLRSTPLVRGRSYESQHSPSFKSPIPAALISNPRASFDINMLETPKQTIRTDFSHSSLSSEKQDRMTQLVNYLQETPSAYESHVEIIKILHDGLVDHIYPSSNPNERRNPQTYDLLQDLRDARERMEKLFAVGEDLWNDWLQDESLLAQSAEQRIAVVEKCRRAVEEEAGSIKLWSAYGDWVHHCYSWANNDSLNAENGLDEEKMVGRELFTWQLVLDTWHEAIKQTSHNLAQSHVIWNKYLELRIPNLREKLNSDQVSTVQSLFKIRLQEAHMEWDNTSQAFSNFVSVNLESQYEQIMIEATRAASQVKDMVSARKSFESAIEQALSAGDRDAEYLAFSRYIEWESTPEKRRKPHPELIDALYKRAELRFPSDTTLWEEHIVFMNSKLKSGMLALLERATKHCPWSGALWSHYLLTSDRMGQSFQETEEIKHKATSSGILEAAGIEQIITVHAAWCSYLRRRSSHPEGSEEDLDVAEMGIRSSIETVSSLGVKLGLGEAPGSSFRLRRIYITFLTENGRWDNARQEFDTSVREFGNSYEFWLQFYHWEMMRWRRFASSVGQTSNEEHTNIEPPDFATAILKKAIDQQGLDYPEPLIQTYLMHCEDYADADELQQALFRVHQVQKTLLFRRQVEAIQNTEVTAAATLGNTQVVDQSSASQDKKRKREDGTVHQDEVYKKARNEEVAQQSIEEPTEVLKRDREHSTVLVQNLPDNISDARIRQYFNNCGVVRGLKVIREEDISAIVEFEDDQAAGYALSRDGLALDGAILSVALDTGSTLYLANYQATADEQYIRNLMEPYGEVVNVRFPSLQGNKRRRFCYVQFKLPEQAQSATVRDGEEIDGLPLICKISDPATRKKRQNRDNFNDGRTVFVGQLNFKTKEDELEAQFSQYGRIELLRMPRDEKLKSRNKGIAFITYASKTDAQNALAMDGQVLSERNITVRIASNESRQSASKATASPAPDVNGRLTTQMDARDDRSLRQVFLTDIPDTVNESRLHAAGEKFGTVSRVILKTNHQGAILEFASAVDAGQASLKMDGYEIDPGRPIRVVTEGEMHSMTKERKVEYVAGAKPRPVVPKATPIGSMAPIRRPGQLNRKGGKLGQRSTVPVPIGGGRQSGGEINGAKKSNNDFRAMLKKQE